MILGVVCLLATPLVLTQPISANQTDSVAITKVLFGPADQEFVELYNPGTTAVDLTGWQLEFLTKQFPDAAGQPTRLLQRFEGVELAPGAFWLVRHPQLSGVVAEAVFTEARQGGSLANSGSVRLVNQGRQVVDLVGWNGADQAESAPAKAATGLQRCQQQDALRDSDNNAADLLDSADLLPGVLVGCPAPPSPEAPPAPAPDPAPSPDNPEAPNQPINPCQALRFSEVQPQADQSFIELHNTSQQTADLTGCQLARGDQRYRFDGVEIPAGGYLTTMLTGSALKIPRRGATVRLLNSAGQLVDQLEYRTVPKGASWSLVDGVWQLSYHPTPDGANQAQPERPCPAGQTRNLATGRCRKTPAGQAAPDRPCPAGQTRNAQTGRCRRQAAAATASRAACRVGQYRDATTGRCHRVATGRASKAAAVRRLAVCRPGYYRHPVTGRCRSTRAIGKLTKPCATGQVRNPATGRCKKLATKTALKECPAGYQRNPQTRRCRKAVPSQAAQAGFAPIEAQQTAGATWAWWAVGGVGLLAAGFAGWQWRWEILQAIRRLKSAVTSGK